ncbi:FliM/FliN family flagellar motor switch protein [Rhodobacter sp. KR11]|uniref:FliM/FliN family flagellar motor switch protein n=1 Tax=Rhodobacter sp. KR11 TaxID=2974588 RepID=UPI0022220B87|nr:FliM/FliN family flagellar motor switch protein [Rhodobacter sp. KR11]MCW1919331.1 FliM/FliN family flagellar motor switch protein [Rhodobacter sp. KR11]
MAEAGIIRKKLAASRVERAEGGPGADRAWRVSLARAVQDHLKLSLDVRSLSIERRSLAELAELIPERALIAILEGPSEGLGAIIVSQPVLTGFIEAQTIGRLRSQEVVPRKPTRTDAAMVASVIDAALEGLETQLAEEADLVWAGGFHYASFLDDPRPLVLLLEDAPLKLLRAEVSLGGGVRVGSILLAVPAEGRGQQPSAADDLPAIESHGPAFATLLAEKVMDAQARVDAVLARVTLSLGQIMGLEVGAVVPLGDAALDAIRLEGLDGKHVADGKLGQNRGLRAIRIAEAMGLRKATGETEGEMGGLSLGGMGGGFGGGMAAGLGAGLGSGLGGFGSEAAGDAGFEMPEPMAADLGNFDFAAVDMSAGLEEGADFPAMDFPAMGADALGEFLPTGTD